MKSIGLKEQQLQQMKTHPGFIAALDQSGGSTPGALRLYGIKQGAWSNEDEMFAIVHRMRTRMITSPGFTGEWIIGAILFENTMDRDIHGQPTADYLWNVKRVVPFLKVDKGLASKKDGVQLMRPMPARPYPNEHLLGETTTAARWQVPRPSRLRGSPDAVLSNNALSLSVL